MPTNNVWANKTPSGVAEDITVPSGQTCKANRLGMEGIIRAGLLGDADTLTAFVGKQHIIKHRGGKQADNDELDMRSVLADPEAFGKMIRLCDQAMPVIVVEPRVELHYKDDPANVIPVEEREDGVVYTDQIDFQDKVFLFNFAVGGTRDIERFREESNRAVDDLADEPVVPHPAKRPARNQNRRSRR